MFLKRYKNKKHGRVYWYDMLEPTSRPNGPASVSVGVELACLEVLAWKEIFGRDSEGEKGEIVPSRYWM